MPSKNVSRAKLHEIVGEISNKKKPPFRSTGDLSAAPANIKALKKRIDEDRRVVCAWEKQYDKAREMQCDAINTEARKVRLVIETGTVEEARKAIEQFEKFKV
jgi:hypothetical protein